MTGRLGDYDLISKVAQGSTAEVWRARRRSGLGQVVAVKVLHGHVPTEDRHRLLAEAAVLNELDHPHIVGVLDVIEEGRAGEVALVMPFAPGGTLVDVLAETGALTPGATVAVVAPLAAALASAHRRRVLHGDVKPGNVLFTSDGEPLLADFGANRVGERIELTPDYAAPEVKAGGSASPASDVFSLALVAAEALTGERPTGGLTVGQDWPGGGANLAAVIGAALDPEAAQRPSADVFERWLRGSVDGAAIVLPGPATSHGAAGAGTRAFGPQPQRTGESSTRRTMKRAGVVGLVAIVATGAVLFLGGGDEDAGCPDVPVSQTPGAQVLEADFDGDGCATPASFTPNAAGGTGVLRVSIDGSEQFEARVGGVDDVLIAGDWNCDGADRPALFRPSDGTIVYLETLEAGAAAEAVDLAGTGTEVSVVSEDGCERVVRGD